MLQTSVTFSLTMVGANDVYEHLFGSAEYSISLFAIIWFLFVGIFAAFGSWDAMEGKYTNSLIDARVKASTSGALPPHNNSFTNSIKP